MGDLPIADATGSFDVFYRAEYRAVLGLAVALAGNRSVAEELVQEAFLAGLRDWDRVAAMDNPAGWVRRVIANRCVSRFRRRVAASKALLRLGWSSSHHADRDLEEAMDVWREVRGLPRRQAQVIALVYVTDLPRSEVAEILGCTEETVKTHLERARRTLARRLSGLRDEGP